MHILIGILLLPFFITSQVPSDNPFLKLKFDKLIMYDFEGNKGSDLYIINEKGELAKSVSKKIQISNTEAGRFSSKVGSRKSYGGTTASCFDPHLGFVYYLKGKVVAHITICLDCNRLSSSIDIPAKKQGKVGKGKEIYYTADGLSISFRNYLNGLLKANGFSHQLNYE